MKGDAELIARVADGDLAAYGQIVERYQRLVFSVAYHHMGNVEDARDVAQDVFIRAFVRLHQVRRADHLGSWLRQVAANESRAHLAKRWDAATLPEDRAAADAYGSADARLLVHSALASVDETSRLTLILFYLHAYSLKEIGSFLGEPVTTIKSRLRNARAKLRKELEITLEQNLQKEAPAIADRVMAMIQAVIANDEAKVRTLLQEDPNLASAREMPGTMTTLHIAASAGNTPVMELLLAHDADANALDTGGDNALPIHYAAERGWLDAVRLLVEAGSDINQDTNIHERSPLGWAVIFGTVQAHVADYLLAHGAKFDLFSAIALGREDVVRRLIADDPSVLKSRMSECERRQTPIEFAAAKRQFAIARLLIELGSDVNLAEAAALGLEDRVRSFLASDPPGDQLDYALYFAVKAGQRGTVRQLLSHGANPNAHIYETSVLFDAIGNNDEAMARLLIEFGADIEYKDAQWNSSPLGWQVFFGNPTTTRLCLRLGAKPIPDWVDLALSGERGELRRFSEGTPEGYREVAKLLREALAS